VQQKYRSLGSRQALHQDEERHRDLVDELHALESGRTQVHRLRKPVAPALLVTRPCGAELVQTEPGHRGEEKSPWRHHLLRASLPANPRLLHCILGASDVAEHAIRKCHQPRAMRLEDVGFFVHGSVRLSRGL
jgi:hypothetical protein